MSEAITGNQERNIMIMFLSNLHGNWVDKANRKFGWSSKKKPYVIYKQETVECRETNEAPLKDILTFLKTDEVEHRYLDAVFCFTTNRVRNCDKDGNKQSDITVIKMKNKDEQDELDGMEWISASEEDFFWNELAPNLTDNTFRKVERIEDIGMTPKDTVWRISVPFNEVKGGPVNSAIKAVTAMEMAIKAYLRHEGVPITKCNIYADTTGGFRPANMAMSAVMQLLGYQEAKLRRVVYSDGERVSNVQDINDMYQLVAGVDAFTKYGRSKALDDYFKDVKKDYAPLQVLLDAMNAFSDSVLLCQPSDIEKNLETLVKALENFREDFGIQKDRPVKVALFARMLRDLEAKYKPMYPDVEEGKERKTDRLAIIRWCIDNTSLQQAITFCTEWLPEYFVNHGVFFTEDDMIQSYCNEKMTTYRSGQKNLLMEFCADNREWEKIVNAVVKDNVNDLIDGKKQARAVKMEIPEIYHNFIDNLCSFLKCFEDDLIRKQSGEKITNWKLEKMLYKIEHAKNKKSRKELSKIVKEDIVKRLPAWIYLSEFQFEYPELKRYEGYRPVKKINIIGKGETKNSIKIKNMEEIAREMLRCGMIETEFRDKEKAVHFLKEYSYIRIELRNKICHASEEEEQESAPIKIEDVVNKLSIFLKEIEMLETFKNTNKPKYTGKWKPKRDRKEKEAAK